MDVDVTLSAGRQHENRELTTRTKGIYALQSRKKPFGRFPHHEKGQ
jgi:hypothetical protein